MLKDDIIVLKNNVTLLSILVSIKIRSFAIRLSHTHTHTAYMRPSGFLVVSALGVSLLINIVTPCT